MAIDGWIVVQDLLDLVDGMEMDGLDSHTRTVHGSLIRIATESKRRWPVVRESVCRQWPSRNRWQHRRGALRPTNILRDIAEDAERIASIYRQIYLTNSALRRVTQRSNATRGAPVRMRCLGGGGARSLRRCQPPWRRLTTHMRPAILMMHVTAGFSALTKRG